MSPPLPRQSGGGARSSLPLAFALLCLLLFLDASGLSPSPPAYGGVRSFASLVPTSTSSGPRVFPPPPAVLPHEEGIISFNVIITTGGRPQLGPLLESLAPQLTADDYITLISDGGAWHAHAATVFFDVPCNCTKHYIANSRALGWWGHGSRNKWQRSLAGAFHLHADDDDLYAPDAFKHIRAAITSLEPRLYVFRLIRRWDGLVGLIPPMSVTRGSQIKPRAVSTQCGVYRAVPELMAFWAYVYGGDGIFYQALASNFGHDNVTLVPAVIYQMGQGEALFDQAPALLAALPDAPAPDVNGDDSERVRAALTNRPESAGQPKWMKEQ